MNTTLTRSLADSRACFCVLFADPAHALQPAPKKAAGATLSIDLAQSKPWSGDLFRAQLVEPIRQPGCAPSFKRWSNGDILFSYCAERAADAIPGGT